MPENTGWGREDKGAPSQLCWKLGQNPQQLPGGEGRLSLGMSLGSAHSECHRGFYPGLGGGGFRLLGKAGSLPAGGLIPERGAQVWRLGNWTQLCREWAHPVPDVSAYSLRTVQKGHTSQQI